MSSTGGPALTDFKSAERTLFSLSPLFTGVSPESVGSLLQGGRLRALEPGEVLLDPARPNTALHIVVAGTVTVHLGSTANVPVRHGEVGEVLGEMSLIDGGNPSAYVVAGMGARVFSLDADLLWTLVDNSHGVARNLLRIVTGRVRAANVRQLEIEQSASVDALTGLHNRRWLDEMFDRQLKRCRHDDRPVAIVMIDVDRFKSVNDEQGHAAGDAVLRAVGRTLLTTLRPNDLLARYGGEEFACMLPATTAADGCRVAERIRRNVEALEVPLSDDRTLRVTVSLGVAGWREGRSCADMLAAADAALLRAKQTGRNRWLLGDGEE